MVARDSYLARTMTPFPSEYSDIVGGKTGISWRRHPELPTRSRGVLVGTWEVVCSVGGAVSPSLLVSSLIFSGDEIY